MNDACDSRIHLLVAEDDCGHSGLIESAFAPLGAQYRFTFARTLQEAAACLEKDPPHLVLVDFLLPDGRGTRLITEANHHPAPAVVVMTSHGSENAAVESVKAGALDYIVKTPEVLADMPRIVERALREWRLIQERKALEEQLRQAQKMESIGQLAGGVAHDFNNLLTAIIGYADMTLTDLDDRESIIENLEQIRKAGERASQLTAQLLSFARRQILSPSILSLNELILNLERMLRRLISEDIELVILPSDDLWLVKADPGLLEQVIINMVVNARQAMPSGGKLTILLANHRIEENQVAPLSEIGPGDYVVLSIGDTGVGMREEVKRHIFEPFFTTKERGKGSGLGLATSYGIVRQSGGTISFESEVGRGTTFRIYLPRTLERQSGRPAADARILPRGRETILVVEDEAAVRGFTIKSLRNLGYTILEASNGPEAICLVRDYAGKIDLLLTDMIMPQMSGKNVADEVQIMRPEIKVLFSSGYTEGMIVHDGVLDSDIFFLQKPYTSSTLAHMVRKVLDSQD